MPGYKKVTFLKAIRVRIEAGEGTAQEIIDTYTKLSDAEREELRKEFT